MGIDDSFLRNVSIRNSIELQFVAGQCWQDSSMLTRIIQSLFLWYTLGCSAVGLSVNMLVLSASLAYQFLGRTLFNVYTTKCLHAAMWAVNSVFRTNISVFVAHNRCTLMYRVNLLCMFPLYPHIIPNILVSYTIRYSNMAMAIPSWNIEEGKTQQRHWGQHVLRTHTLSPSYIRFRHLKILGNNNKEK